MITSQQTNRRPYIVSLSRRCAKRLNFKTSGQPPREKGDLLAQIQLSTSHWLKQSYECDKWQIKPSYSV